MCREYIAVKNLTPARRIANQMDLDRDAVISIISLIKLIDGGAAMLAAANINHHIVIIGLRVMSPLVRNILRVWVISYDKLAKINSAEDLNP